MTKLLVTALFSALATAMVIYAIQPVSAAVPSQSAATVSANPVASLDLSMPPPQEPFDMTPITPFETVGAAHHEPF